MKNFTILSLMLLMLFPILSCHRNRLNTNEKELAKEIILLEKEKEEADKAAREKQLADTLNRPPSGSLFKEDRSVDPARPPLVIDIASSLSNVKEIKLSDFAGEIRYIRMQPPPDSAFRKEIGFRYHLTEDYIIAINSFGMLQYTRNGRYVNTIVKNEFTKIEVTPDYVMSYGDMTFIGARNPTVKSSGNKLYYTYVNNITGQEYLMEYDCSEMQVSQTIKYDPEEPDKILGHGKIKVDLNHGRAIPIPAGKNPGAVRYTIQGSGMNWIDDNYYMKKLKGNNMLGIFNKDGDTLSTFTQHERLINYTKSLQRGVDGGEQYEFNGKLYFRNAFNDTVFQVIPPNRLLPVYVLNFGNYKVNRQQGVDPGFDLTGKIILDSWAETKNHIFLTFTKDNYNCIANRKGKKVKIYHALFSKENHQLFIINGDPLDYSPEILGNNIDGGIPVWQSSFETGIDGEILKSLKGKRLKERVRSEKFKLSDAPEAKKNELKQLAASVSDYEDILMLIK